MTFRFIEKNWLMPNRGVAPTFRRNRSGRTDRQLDGEVGGPAA